MRMGRLGLWSLITLVAACDKPTDPKPPEDPPEPEPTTYRVGGSLSGLVGSVTLRLNAQESLTREADGPFTFQTRVVDEGDYAVSVATPPPEQDCTVTAGTGKVAGADVGAVQVRCVTRTYALGGTVEGLDGPLELSLGGETLRLTTAGPFTFTTRLPRGGAYTVAVATPPQGQRCTVSNASGTVAGDVDGLSVRCRYWYALDTFQAASGVLGQADFTHRAADRGGPTQADTLNNPLGNAAFAGGRLYVTDTAANRILGLTGVPTTLGPSADFVLGQATFEDARSGSGQEGLGAPEGVSSDGLWLAVADTRNSRILLYTALPGGTGATPARVVGQPGFTPNDPSGEPGDTTASTTQRTLAFPKDVFIGHGKLLVADSGNNRVLIWNTLPTGNSAPADLVLGQLSFTLRAPNDANGDAKNDGTASATTLWNPTGVWTDGTRLVVADSFNNRVLLWNTFPTLNAQPADGVLGQPDFSKRASALTASGMNTPSSVASSGLQLFVSDTQNHRVLVWNELPTQNGRPAEVVLGQRDFTHADTSDPTSGSAPSASSLNQPAGLLLAGPRVLVSDYGNNRVLVFTSR